MDRRAFLAAAGSAAATLAAGCLGGVGGADEPELEPMTRWALPADDEDPLWGYRMSAYSFDRMLDVAAERDELDGSGADERMSLAWGEIDPGDLTRFVSVVPTGVDGQNPYLVYRGTFDEAAARDALAAASERQPGSHGEYDLYGGVTLPARGDASVAYAVGDGTVIQINDSFGEPGTTEQARRVVDVASGDLERVTETSEPIRAVAARLDPGLASRLERQPAGQSGGNGRYAGVTATGSYVTADDGSLRRHVAFVFGDEITADADRFEEFASDFHDDLALDSSTIEVDGTVVTGSGTLPDDALL